MSAPANILIIDDDESIRVGCAQALSTEGHRVRTAPNGMLGLSLAQEESFDVVLLDLRMPGLGGMTVLEKLKKEDPDLVVTLITGQATIESAVEGMRKGAWDYLPKPFTPEMLITVVNRAIEHKRLALENAYLRMALKEKAGTDELVGQSPAMRRVTQLIEKAAASEATVLLTGETGVGKELAARALHRLSYRRDKPFVTVDCASLVESLFESELFGHVRGAYTDAIETTIGKLELAHTGTLFFDEVGNISPALQVKLLRVIQEREFMKVGSSRRVKVDVRIIAATNNDLLRDVRDGRFREDLFFRLSVIPIQLPPLRERTGDIRLLAYHFLKKFNTRRKRNVTGFSEEALRALDAYSWPGNVREMENTIERALVMAEGEVIEVDDLLFYGPTSDGHCAALSPLQASPLGDMPLEGGQLAKIELREISAALKQFDGQMERTAAYLGINRKTLREKMRRYGLCR
ncbi:MAG: sigma-54 dependent transcriptional regulator [Rectinema sp.]